MIMTNINFLRIPLYKLKYDDALESINGLTKDELLCLKKGYTKQEIASIKKALKWAKENPKHDFQSMLSNIKYNNKEIYDYLMLILTQIK